jgi:hypothetical protein
LEDPFYVKGNLGMWNFDLDSVRRRSEKANASLKESLAALTAAQKSLMNSSFAKAMDDKRACKDL